MPPILEFADGAAALDTESFSALIGKGAEMRVSDVISALPASQRIRVHGALCDGEPVQRDFIVRPEHRITLLRLPSVLSEADRKPSAPIVVRYDSTGPITPAAADSRHPAVRALIQAFQTRRRGGNAAGEGASASPTPSPDLPSSPGSPRRAALPSMAVIGQFLSNNYLDEGAALLNACATAEAKIERMRQRKLRQEAAPKPPSFEERRAMLFALLPTDSIPLMQEMGFSVEAIQRMLFLNQLDAEAAANALFACDNIEALSGPLSDAEIKTFADKYVPLPPPVIDTSLRDLDSDGDGSQASPRDPNVGTLVSMGFDPAASANALRIAKGNVEMACTLLLENRPLPPPPPQPVENVDWKVQLRRRLVANAANGGANLATPADIRELIRMLLAKHPIEDVRTSEVGRRALAEVACVLPRRLSAVSTASSPRGLGDTTNLAQTDWFGAFTQESSAGDNAAAEAAEAVLQVVAAAAGGDHGAAQVPGGDDAAWTSDDGQAGEEDGETEEEEDDIGPDSSSEGGSGVESNP